MSSGQIKNSIFFNDKKKLKEKIKIRKKGKKVLQTQNTSLHMFLIRHAGKRVCFPAGRRISPVSSYQAGAYMAKGSLTVEAAFVMPLFLLSCFVILSLVDAMRIYTETELKLHQSARQLSVYAAAGSVADTGGKTDSFGSSAAAQSASAKQLTAAIQSASATQSASAGAQTDWIDLSLVYPLSPQIKGPGFRVLILKNRCKVHKFNGYDDRAGDQINKEREEYVYITDRGSVYHRKRSCRFLNISIKEVKGREIAKKRSKDGEKYYACSVCCSSGAGEKGQTFYITDYGNRYHASILCPDLKRTIRVVLLSQAGGRKPCKECGQNG